MIIDDDLDVSQIVGEVLADRGYEPVVINETEGRAKLIRDRIAEENPSVVLLDLMMPGLDGFQILEMLQSDPRTAAVPVIVFTAAVQSIGDLQEYYGASIADFITKPFDFDSLLEKVSRASRRVSEVDGSGLSKGL